MNIIKDKIWKVLIPFAGVLLMPIGGCSDMESTELETAEEREVTFHIEMPADELSTRVSNSDSKYLTVNLLQWSIYEVVTDENGNTTYDALGDQESNTAIVSNKATLSMTLAKGRKYLVTFFAKNSENKVVTYKDGVMTIDYSHADAISHNLSAYTGKVELKQDSEPEVTVDLYRKQSFVGWYCRDLGGNTTTNIGWYIFSKDGVANKIKYNLKFNTPVYNTYDLKTDVISGEISNLTYSERAIYNGSNLVESSGNTEPLNSTTYYLVCYNYILTKASDAQGTIDMELEFYHPEIPDYNIKVASNSIPVRQNYKTNIFGNFLTNGEIFGVTLQRDFDGESPISPLTP